MCVLGGLPEEAAFEQEPVEGRPRRQQVEGPGVRVCEDNEGRCAQVVVAGDEGWEGGSCDLTVDVCKLLGALKRGSVYPPLWPSVRLVFALASPLCLSGAFVLLLALKQKNWVPSCVLVPVWILA